jgi:hypothetical protein
MKTVIATLIALVMVLILAPAAFAGDDLYLPTIANRDTALSAAGSPVDFAISEPRLWDIYENGGQPGTPVQCGQDGRVQVDVFRVGGDTGPGARLDGVTVHVLQYLDGQVTEETLVTGTGGQPGQVTFALRGWAEVKLLADGAAGAVSSGTAFVSGYPGGVGYQQLQQGLYCSDDASCTALVQSAACGGKLSWNLVFIRAY